MKINSIAPITVLKYLYEAQKSLMPRIVKKDRLRVIEIDKILHCAYWHYLEKSRPKKVIKRFKTKK